MSFSDDEESQTQTPVAQWSHDKPRVSASEGGEGKDGDDKTKLSETAGVEAMPHLRYLTHVEGKHMVWVPLLKTVMCFAPVLDGMLRPAQVHSLCSGTGASSIALEDTAAAACCAGLQSRTAPKVLGTVIRKWKRPMNKQILVFKVVPGDLSVTRQESFGIGNALCSRILT